MGKLFALSIIILAGACSAPPSSPSSGGEGESLVDTTPVPEAGSSTASSSCSNAAVQECSRHHTPGPAHTTNCFSGYQTCTEGTWGPCGDGPPAPDSVAKVFTATCPAGTIVHWTSLTYDVTLPAADSEARFEAAPGGEDDWPTDALLTVTVADVKSGGDPTKCSGENGESCAGKLEAHFADFADGIGAMTVRIDLSPPTGSATAVVDSVAALYDCKQH